MKIGTRRLLGGMWTILVLLASALFGACAKITMNAIAGEDVLLPCICKENKVKPYLVWQIGSTTIVDQYISGHEKSHIAHQFQNRTDLFLPEDEGNCSLLLKRITTADNQTFTCHYIESSAHTSSDVTLNVSVAHNGTQDLRKLLSTHSPPSEHPEHQHGKHRVTYATVGVLLAVALLLTVFLTVRYRHRCLISNVNESGAGEGLANFSYNGETRTESLQPYILFRGVYSRPGQARPGQRRTEVEYQWNLRRYTQQLGAVTVCSACDHREIDCAQWLQNYVIKMADLHPSEKR
ncbi:hypothetical protein SKAU_G00259440 [Synaphobranchus kaupii]|uniref:Ig-like domain-containing protein n=1 Tax=Synaphobranchus kaupii TaxID=118154 RepID=A0A9Q1F4K7_SYNKA|nr:hypothetical protein SKAU_G00259440 [Synaphobranchus kaupii]